MERMLKRRVAAVLVVALMFTMSYPAGAGAEEPMEVERYFDGGTYRALPPAVAQVYCHVD